MRRLLASLVLALGLAGPALAVQPDEMLKDPALEARARALSAELRCLVCQNQSIDDSDAELARDLRILLRERIAAGDSDQKVIDFLVARYGDFILLKPPFKTETLLLWATPPTVVVLGVILLLSARRRRPAETAPLSDAEKQDLQRILSESPENGGEPPANLTKV